MIKSLEQRKKLIELLKGNNPAYTEILGFYEKIVEAQEAEKPDISIGALHIQNNVKALQTREGFPLIDRKDFILDIPFRRPTLRVIMPDFAKCKRKDAGHYSGDRGGHCNQCPKSQGIAEETF